MVYWDDYWDGLLGWFTEMVYWDDYWDGSQGVTHHHLLLFLRKHFHLDSLCEELMVEKIFHSESADKRGQLQLMHTRETGQSPPHC